MKLESLSKLLQDELKDLHSAESQLLVALPKAAKAASHEALQEAFQSHLEETKGQVERLEKIGKILNIKLTGKKCKAMEGLIKECQEAIEAEGPAAVLDASLIGAAQRIEHYEIAAYGTARAFAEHLGNDEVVELLTETLTEEAAADEKLTALSLEEILPQTDSEESLEDESEAGEDADEDEDDADDEKESADASSRAHR